MSIQRTGAAVGAFLLSFLGAAAALAEDGLGAPVPWQMGMQAPASTIKDRMQSFHDLLLVIITVITLFVLALLVYVILRFGTARNPSPSRTSHNTILEIAWTAIPVIILLVIAVPSFKLLYFADRTAHADMTLKIIGHQWYWEYQYPELNDADFNSVMIPTDQLQPGQRRLLEVDNQVVLPIDTNVRLLFTSGDVMHSWLVSAIGVQMAALPGRINETWVRIEHPGVYYGQCTMICGVNHGFMPIAIKAVTKDEYAAWAAKAKQAFAPPVAPGQVAAAAAP